MNREEYGGRVKEKIELLSKGIFSYENSAILPFEDTLLQSVVLGTVQKGTFTVKNASSSKMKGMIISSHSRVRIITKTFIGNVNVIQYEVDGVNLKLQDTIKGVLTLITDCGEVQVPYQIAIESPYFETSIGPVKDLLTFSKLAKQSELSALKIFSSSRFETYILEHDIRSKLLYKEIMKSKNIRHAMEEFLIGVQRKLPVVIEVDKKYVKLEMEENSVKESILLSKEQWGYGEYEISCDSLFIQLEVSNVKTEQFINNMYSLDFIVLKDKIRSGKNYGTIHIVGSKQEIHIVIECHLESEQEKRGYNKYLGMFNIEQMKNYTQFRKNQKNLTEFEKDGISLIDKLQVINLNYEDRKMCQLLRIYYHMAMGNQDSAISELNDIKKEALNLKDKNRVLYCGYEYLRAFVFKEDAIIYRSTELIHRMYEENPNNFFVLWFLFYMDKRYHNNPRQKLLKLKEHFKLGCISPMLYLEAALIYMEEPALFQELETFELLVFNFMRKEGFSLVKFEDKYVHFVKNKKVVSNLSLTLLFHMYHTHKSTQVLSTICKLLIRNHMSNPKYHKWFELGVQEGLRITELYEYFMYSLSEKKEIIPKEYTLPKQVILYFSYNSTLADKKKAYLYAYIIVNRDYYKEVFHSYKLRMKEFAVYNIMKHNINYNLSIIYQYFLKFDTLEDEILEALTHVIFRYEISCSYEDIRSAYVVYDELKEYSMTNIASGMGQLDIYNKNYQLFLVDNKGNHFRSTSLYVMEQLFPWEEYIHIYHERDMLPTIIMASLYKSNQITSTEHIFLGKELIQFNILNEEEKISELIRIAEYYFVNFDGKGLDQVLEKINISLVAPQKRSYIIELFIIREKIEEAIRGIKLFGMEGIDGSKLVKLCNQLIQGHPDGERNDEFSKSEYLSRRNLQSQGQNLVMDSNYDDKFITKLGYHIFKVGNYTLPILEHLIRYYNGATSDLFLLWECGIAFELKTAHLEERLLVQILFTNHLIHNSFSVFEKYYIHGKNEDVILAYLSFISFKYLMEEKEVSDEIALIIKKEIESKDSDICTLALLKYYSKQDFLNKQDIHFIDYHISRYVSMGIFLPFFLEFKKYINLPSLYMDRTMISYYGNPSSKVFVYYKNNIQNEKDYKKVEMTLVFLGIFTYSTIVFEKEEFEYYFVEEHNGEVIKESEKYYLPFETRGEEDGSLYGRINKLQEMLCLEEQNQWLESVEEMGREFTILEKKFKAIL